MKLRTLQPHISKPIWSGVTLFWDRCPNNLSYQHGRNSLLFFFFLFPLNISTWWRSNKCIWRLEIHIMLYKSTNSSLATYTYFQSWPVPPLQTVTIISNVQVQTCKKSDGFHAWFGNTSLNFTILNLQEIGCFGERVKGRGGGRFEISKKLRKSQQNSKQESHFHNVLVL